MVKVAAPTPNRERIRDIVRDVVHPADRDFLETLSGDYLAGTREEPGLWSAPDGDTLYRTAIRSWTTSISTPEDVHRIGLEEWARSRLSGATSHARPGSETTPPHTGPRWPPTRPTARSPRTSWWPT